MKSACDANKRISPARRVWGAALFLLACSLVALADWPNAGVYIEAYIPAAETNELEATEELVCRVEATNAAHVVEILDVMTNAYETIRIDHHEHWRAMSGRACVVQPIVDFDGAYYATWRELYP